MGILKEPADLVAGLKLPKGFAVCELGDQWVTYTQPHRLAADWFEELGCGLYVSMDGNGRGTLTVDLNRPLRKQGIGMVDFVNRFDLVTDFGTGEHVFNQAQVWMTIHELTKPGGFIAFDRPTSGYPEHCYYLVHPELLEDIARANGYTIVALEQGETKRGKLIRGVFRRNTAAGFVTPQQGRYHKILAPIMGKR